MPPEASWSVDPHLPRWQLATPLASPRKAPQNPQSADRTHRGRHGLHDAPGPARKAKERRKRKRLHRKDVNTTQDTAEVPWCMTSFGRPGCLLLRPSALSHGDSRSRIRITRTWPSGYVRSILRFLNDRVTVSPRVGPFLVLRGCAPKPTLETFPNLYARSWECLPQIALLPMAHSTRAG